MADRLAASLFAGARVAVGDGLGTPRLAFSALADASRRVGGVHLLLGWSFWLPDLDWSAFASVTTVMGGHALRPLLADGTARYLPVRYGSLPALLGGPLRPDVVLVAARPTPRGLVLGTEVSWLAPAVRNSDRVLVEVNRSLPDATRDLVLPPDRTTVVSEHDRRPQEVPSRPPSPTMARIGEIVASLLPAEATIQLAPGAIGTAVLSRLDAPVAIDSGVVTDDVVDLDRRGLLRGPPTAAYLLGTAALHEWAHERPILTGVEVTHDVSRLAAIDRFVAVNTALQIDLCGQVNVEGVGGDVIGGVGGHADYALGASRSAGGLSIIALASANRGRSALVERLGAPTTTPRSDIGVVVTEHGHADLRGLADAERAVALWPLFPAGVGAGA